MNIFKNIIKRLKNKEKAEDKLAIKLVNDISCINGESFEKWTENAKKDPSLNAIFEVSEFDKQLKKITTREEATLFLEERKRKTCTSTRRQTKIKKREKNKRLF